MRYPSATSLIVVKHVIVYKEGEGEIEREFADEINLTVTIMSDATLSMTLNLSNINRRESNYIPFINFDFVSGCDATHCKRAKALQTRLLA